MPAEQSDAGLGDDGIVEVNVFAILIETEGVAVAGGVEQATDSISPVGGGDG